MLTRREFLGRGLALSGSMPALWQSAALAAENANRNKDTILVVLELNGGNDGLNTVVPFADDIYHKSRPTLRIEPDKVLKLDDRLGFHPAMKELHGLWKDGLVTVINGVGYPNPNRSHLRSLEIWQSGMIEPSPLTGWLGRAADHRPQLGLCALGETTPLAVLRRQEPTPTMSSTTEFRLPPSAAFSIPNGPNDDPVLKVVRRRIEQARKLSERMAPVADRLPPLEPEHVVTWIGILKVLIDAEPPFRVFYLSVGGFDTHVNQQYQHQSLLGGISRGLGTLFKLLRWTPLADRLMVLIFSEFGRRLVENGQRGTDHGTAAPMLLIGKKVKGGLVGPPPNLTDLDERGDPKFTIDYRDVYANVLRQWLDVDPTRILGQRNSTIENLFRG